MSQPRREQFAALYAFGLFASALGTWITHLIDPRWMRWVLGGSFLAVAAWMLVRFGGQTQRQAAAHLDIGSGGAVSAQVRKLPAMLEGDRRLSQKVKAIERELKTWRKTQIGSAAKRAMKRH